MSKLKPITVTLKESRHKKQPWTFTIDRPGPADDETKEERYVTMTTAKRGACRVLGALYSDRWYIIMKLSSAVEMTKKGNIIRPVVFVVQRLPKKKP
jgi:hypothetical protein